MDHARFGSHRFSRQSLSAFRGLLECPGPSVGGEYLIEGWLGHNLVSVHGAGYDLRDLVKGDAALAKRFDGDFIGRVEDRRHCATHLSRAPGQRKRGKTFRV